MSFCPAKEQHRSYCEGVYSDIVTHLSYNRCLIIIQWLLPLSVTNEKMAKYMYTELKDLHLCTI